MKIRINLILAGLTLLSILFSMSVFAEAPTPQAVKGVIDFSQTSLDEAEQLSLPGEWEFYWKQRLEPKEFNSLTPSKLNYMDVPSSWKGKTIDGETLDSTGFATYRLRLLIHPSDIGTEKVLELGNVGSAYTLWINGVNKGSVGQVGRDAFEEKASLQINHYSFIPTTEQVEIVIQVSNFSYRKAGLYSPVTYQNPTDVLHSTIKSEMDTFLIAGGLLFMGIYNLIMFAVTVTFQRDIFLIGMASIFMALRSLLVNDYVSTILFSDLPLSIVKRMEYIAETFTFLFVILSMRFLYPKETHPILVKATYIYVLFCVIYDLLAPTLMFTQTVIYQFLIMVIITSYFLFYVGGLAFLRKREGAAFTFVGLIILILGILNDVLSSALIIPSVFELQYSFLIFIMLQAAIVSYRYLSLFKRNQLLNKQLLEMNEQLEVTVEHRTKELIDKNKELGQANLKLEALSSTDGLTGLANRRHLNQVLAIEWSKAGEQDQSLAILLLDIDYYKSFNDTYGHLCGDEGLKLVANVLKDHTQATNRFAARYGGEEFAVILSDTTLEKATDIAEDIRKSVEDLQEPHKGSPYGFLSVSIGVAIVKPQPDLRSENLLEQADRALYQAKKEGRNQVIAFTTVPFPFTS